MKKSAFKFSSFQEPTLSTFEKLFNIFKELIIHTSGDFDEAIEWLRELDKEYKLTDENYTIDDFVNDLLKKQLMEEKQKQEQQEYQLRLVIRSLIKEAKEILDVENVVASILLVEDLRIQKN